MNTILLNASHFGADRRLLAAMAILAAVLIAVGVDVGPAFAGGTGADG